MARDVEVRQRRRRGGGRKKGEGEKIGNARRVLTLNMQARRV